jgi:hypothetical protein
MLLASTQLFEQVIILCFESYFLVEMGLSGGWMTICAFGILLQTMSIVILVALSASYVHEEVSILPYFILKAWPHGHTLVRYMYLKTYR